MSRPRAYRNAEWTLPRVPRRSDGKRRLPPLGDLDGDGCLDILVGAPGKDGPLGGEGGLWILNLHTVIDNRHTVIDSHAPEVKLSAAGKHALIGFAYDARPSEDVEGSQTLPPAEDLNGNERIDQDMGVAAVSLAHASSILVLTVDAFEFGDGSVGFRVGLVDAMLPGSGAVLVHDRAGNLTSREIDRSCRDHDSLAPGPLRHGCAPRTTTRQRPVRLGG